MWAKTTVSLFQFIKAKGNGNEVTEWNSVKLLNICWESTDNRAVGQLSSSLNSEGKTSTMRSYLSMAEALWLENKARLS